MVSGRGGFECVFHTYSLLYRGACEWLPNLKAGGPLRSYHVRIEVIDIIAIITDYIIYHIIYVSGGPITADGGWWRNRTKIPFGYCYILPIEVLAPLSLW